MKYTVLAYYDKDVEKYNPPFLLPFGLEDSVSSVIDGVKKRKIENPEAFELYHLGWFDTETGQITVLDKPSIKAILSDYVRKAD